MTKTSILTPNTVDTVANNKVRTIIFPETVMEIIIHTTAGNSSLTNDMIRDVFPTLAVYTHRKIKEHYRFPHLHRST